MDIKWGNKPLKVCPFKIDVHSPVYPEKVGVTGPNLKTGVIGKDLDLKIDPRDAGHGRQFSYTYLFVLYNADEVAPTLLRLLTFLKTIYRKKT